MTEKTKGCALGCLLSVFILVVVNAGMALLGYFLVKDAADGLGKEFPWAKCHGGSSGTELGGVDEFPAFDEVWSTGSEEGEKFVRIAINGVINLSAGGGTFLEDGAGTAAFALDAIKAAANDDEVRGIILEIDSPGGGVTDSDIIYNELCKFKASAEGRVVFVLAGDLCASGGYYISAAADYVMAHPTTMLGSIGVIMPGMNFKPLADKLGVSEDSVSSGANKRLGVLGDMSDSERAMRQAIVDDMHARFVGLVAKGRNLPEEKVREIADGSVFSAAKARELGLVDGVGYYDDAIAELKKLAGVEEVYVVRYEDPESIKGFKGLRKLFGQAVIGTLSEVSTPRREFRLAH